KCECVLVGNQGIEGAFIDVNRKGIEKTGSDRLSNQNAHATHVRGLEPAFHRKTFRMKCGSVRERKVVVSSIEAKGRPHLPGSERRSVVGRAMTGPGAILRVVLSFPPGDGAR